MLSGVAEIEAARIVRVPLFNDRRELTGPFDIIGDVHGCRSELEALLGRLGWTIVRDEDGRAVDAVHPDGRTAVFVGDLIDRGPDTAGVLRLVMGMSAAGRAWWSAATTRPNSSGPSTGATSPPATAWPGPWLSWPQSRRSSATRCTAGAAT